MLFYNRIYRSKDNGDYIGHDYRDPSGLASYEMEERFSKDYILFQQSGKKIENLASVYSEIKNTLAL
jgi:hypothetical protein